jgi:Zn-dependent protease with chaperone function
VIRSPYGWEYFARTVCATVATLVVHAVLIVPLFLVAFAFVETEPAGLTPIRVVVGIVVCWLTLGFYYVACRLLFQPISEPKVIDVFMSRWVSSQAGVKIKVYRSSWNKTFSRCNVFASGGNIFLGIDTLALSRLALTFVILHEVAHITARGAPVRRLNAFLLRYVDSLNDLRSKKSMLLERKTPRIRNFFLGIFSLFREEMPLQAGIFWVPIRCSGIVLTAFQSIVSMIIGPLTRKEEFYADKMACEKLGSAARTAMAECALHFARIDRADSKQVAIRLAGVLQEWSCIDLHQAVGSLKTKLTTLRINAAAPSWYPTWKERYLHISKVTEKRNIVLVPRQFVQQLPIGDNMILSETDLVVRAYSYLHPVLIFCLTYSLIAVVGTLLLWVLDKAPSDGGLGAGTSVMIIPFFVVLAYGFLRGEEEVQITKCMLGPKVGIDSAWDQTDTWLSARLPKSLRTRLVIALIGPLMIVALLFYLPKLLVWIGPEPETREALRRLGKLSGRDRIALMKAFSFGPNRQLLNRDHKPRTRDFVRPCGLSVSGERAHAA